MESSIFLSEADHYVLYGKNPMESYVYCLKQLETLSPSALKYSRKTMIEHQGQELAFSMSDVHVEVDFAILGVNEYTIFFELFRHISENVVLNHKNRRLYIVCLHFDNIKKELMDVFYNFLDQQNIVFVFLVKHISYVHPYILKRAAVKKIKSNVLTKYDDRFTSRIDAMIPHIVENNEWSLFQWREKLYELLILNDNIHDCFAYLIQCLVENGYLKIDQMDSFFSHYADIMEKYNNNYRTIYHLERFIVYIRNLKTTTQE